MARIERIKRRLDNWAIWKERQNAGGLGYATQSILLSTWARGSYNGVAIPVFEEEASETDAAVQSLKLTRSHLYVVIECIYLRDLGIRATAQRMARAESTVKANLEQADQAIDAWLSDKAQEKARRADTKSSAGSFTT